MNIKKTVKSLLAGAMALGGLFASAAPTVEITKVTTPDNDCKVTCAYTVGGLEGKNYDLVLKVGATDSTKGAVSTNLVFEWVAEGAANRTIDCKAVLGKAYPNVTFYAMLQVGKEPWQKDIGAVQLWEGGPYWADRNVGATKPEEAGFYFWWGDTEGYVRNAADDGWVSAKGGKTAIQFSSTDAKAGQTYGKSNATLLSEGWIDESDNLTMAHDAARVNLGGEWRMPTDAEIVDLIQHTTTTWTAQNGVYGWLVKGNGAYSNVSIFFPAAGLGRGSSLDDSGSLGCCWSSTPYSGNSNFALSLGFNSSNFIRSSGGRNLGFTVRPVRGFAE